MKYIKTDLTSIEVGILAHGVNCQRTMNSGVAKAIREKFPKAYTAYMDIPVLFQKAHFGTAHIVDIAPGGAPFTLFVAHCFTQKTYGRDEGVKYASVDAIVGSMRTVIEFSMRMRLPIYLPKIGCGLGGLDWETEVKPALEALEKEYADRGVLPTELTICEL